MSGFRVLLADIDGTLAGRLEGDLRAWAEHHLPQPGTEVSIGSVFDQPIWATGDRAQREAATTMPVNEGLIRSTSQALAEAQTEMALAQARVHGEIWTLLTPEQQAKAKELRTQRENRMKERRERMQQRMQQRRQPPGQPQG